MEILLPTTTSEPGRIAISLDDVPSATDRALLGACRAKHYDARQFREKIESRSVAIGLTSAATLCVVTFATMSAPYFALRLVGTGVMSIVVTACAWLLFSRLADQRDNDVRTAWYAAARESPAIASYVALVSLDDPLLSSIDPRKLESIAAAQPSEEPSAPAPSVPIPVSHDPTNPHPAPPPANGHSNPGRVTLTSFPAAITPDNN